MKFVLVILLLLLGFSPAEAASRFAVCSTTCTWDGSSTAMWSASSGGATGASVPGPADNVTLDGATCVGGTTCTITVNTNFSIFTLTDAACTASGLGCILDFSVNNNNVTIAGNFNLNGTGTRIVKLGSAVLNFPASLTGGAAGWSAQSIPNLTLQAGTSTILYSGTTLGNTGGSNRVFYGGGLTYATVTFAGDVGNGITQVADGGNTFTNLNIGAPNTVFFRFGATQTITNPITWSGSSTQQILITNDGYTGALPSIITSPANATMSWVSFFGITMTGAGTRAATNSFNFGANSGFTITPPTSITDPSTGGSCACILGG